MESKRRKTSSEIIKIGIARMRERVSNMRKEGKTYAEISNILNVRESMVRHLAKDLEDGNKNT